MAQIAYNIAKTKMAETGFSSITFGLLLLDAAGGYVPDPDHDFITSGSPSLATAELVTTNYVRKALTGPTITESDANNRAEMVFSDVLFADLGPVLSGPTIQAGVIYADVGGTDATRWLVAYLDQVTATTNGEDLLVVLDPTGALRVI